MSEGPALSKGPDAFRTISEVAEELDLPQHVLRFWETRFTQIRPMKRGGGRRYYRPDDVDLLRGIRRLLYGEGYTIKGVQRILKEQGPRQVVAAGQGGRLDAVPQGPDLDDDDMGDVPEGILVDRDARREPVATVRREPDSRAPRRVDERREPVFDAYREPIAPVPVRSPGQRAPEATVRAPTPPIAAQPPVFSRIPAAPPDEPDSSDVYLPPLVSTPPQQPERSAIPSYAPEPRRDPEPPTTRPFAQPIEHEAPPEPAGYADDAYYDETETGAELAPDDLRLLQSTLMELLECKRLLDQAR